VKGDYQGDHAKLKDALNTTAEALHGAIAQVAEAVEQVTSASTQIASSSQSVASGASEQASSLEETHASLESMTAQTRQAADNASQASKLATGARSSAQDGAAAMEQMQGAMGKIRHSAEGTSAIIKDISEIAFQTNLLALNAAVEAARAGEAGRGFAVVAEEVRSLALRAKEAAVKTEELIKESVKQAGEGEATSKHVAGKLGEIVAGVSKVTDIVAEIAASSKEQAAGIEQVNKAVAEMDKVTQQNAASSEESSSAAEELSSQPEELAAMVGSFKTERTGGLKRPAPLARKTPATPAKPRHANGKNGHHPLATRPEDVIPLEGETLRDF
jgi:methyl-accepting chemotaxis protein